MSKPVFSVVMPVHNKAPHLRRAIDSVVCQAFPSWELIVVDDASTDGSDKVLLDYRDDRIRTYRRNRPGPGGYAARNLGIEKSEGEWVAFVDADDEWLPNHLNTLSELSRVFPNAEMLGGAWYISDGMVRDINPFGQQNQSVRLIEPEEYISIQARGLDVVHTDVVAVKRRLIKEIGGFPLASPECRRAGDGQTWLRCVLEGARVAWSPEPGAVYYQDSVNMVTRTKRYDLSENCLISFLEDVLNKDPQLPAEFRAGLKKYRNSRIHSHLFQYARHGEVRFEHVAKAFRYFQFDPRLVVLVAAWLLPWVGKAVFKVKDRIGGVRTQ